MAVMQVEILHGPLAHYANGGCHPKLAQLLTLDGIVRFTMDHDQRLQYHQGKVDTDEVCSVLMPYDAVHSSTMQHAIWLV